MKGPLGLALITPLGLITQAFEFLKILYLFGKSDIPVAVLPSVRIALYLITQ